ncbi:MAG: biopolymer transporter ExbD [Myxococcota bacterium]
MGWHSWSAEATVHETAGVDLTVFVDVLFNLLFFFMLTAGMAQHMVLEVQLPQVKGRQVSPQSADPVVSLTQKGALRWGGKELSLNVLLEKLQTLPPADRQRIWLQADGRASHGDVARVMGKLQQISEHIFLVTTAQ